MRHFRPFYTHKVTEPVLSYFYLGNWAKSPQNLPEITWEQLGNVRLICRKWDSPFFVNVKMRIISFSATIVVLWLKNLIIPKCTYYTFLCVYIHSSKKRSMNIPFEGSNCQFTECLSHITGLQFLIDKMRTISFPATFYSKLVKIKHIITK